MVVALSTFKSDLCNSVRGDRWEKGRLGSSTGKTASRTNSNQTRTPRRRAPGLLYCNGKDNQLVIMAPIHTIAALFAVLFSPVFVELCDCFLHPATHQIKHRCIPQLWSAPTALTEPNLTQPIKSTNVSIPNQTRLSEEQLSIRFGPAFAQKIIELAEYKEKFGDCLVPKRYQDNPSLGNFVNKQRQLYRKYLEGENSSMTQVSSCVFHFGTRLMIFGCI